MIIQDYNTVCNKNSKLSSNSHLQGRKPDQEIPAETQNYLQQRIYEFNSMPKNTAKRCLVMGPTSCQQLHVFQDASDIATSAVIEMRSTISEGNVIVNYVIS